MKPEQIIQSLMGLLILVLSGLFTWSLGRINDLNDEAANLRTDIALMQQTLEAIANNSEADTNQNAQLSKQWRIVSTHKDWINDLRAREGLPIVSWPPLD